MTENSQNTQHQAPPGNDLFSSGSDFSSDLPDIFTENPDQHENHHFFNRDLSWLDFNGRVLFQAMDSKTHPLLERVRFLSIYASNLDEFFMKRVGYLKRIVEKDIPVIGPDGLQPVEALEKIREKVQVQLEILDDIYLNTILPELEKNEIYLTKWDDLNDEEKDELTDYFKRKVFPVLTPLAVDPSHPFPFLSNLSVSLGIKLHMPKHNQELFARIKIPSVLPQWIPISGSASHRPVKFIRLKDLIKNNLNELFPDMVIDHVTAFRVTRNVDIDQIVEDPDDVLEVIEEELRLRRLANVVRVEYESLDDDWTLGLLEEELELTRKDFY
jgi:polyphosphate kinase